MTQSGVIFGKDNPKAKYLRSLHEHKKASKEGVVYIEGLRLCEDALKSLVIPKIIAYKEDKKQLVDQWSELFNLSSDTTEFLCFSDELFAKISSTVNPQGVSMVVDMPDIKAPIPYRGDGKDIYVCLERLQDPGNLGTIIRLADAFDFTAILMTPGTVDPFNEKVLRATMGSLWHIPIRKVDSVNDVFDFCRERNISTMAMHLKGDTLSEADIKLPCCYFIGNEGNGLTDECTNMCDTMVKIPMAGQAESLNAASAASIIGYILSTKRD